MSRITTLGVILVVLGVAAFVVRQFTYTEREEILDIGPIEATAETRETVVVPVWLAAVLLGSGVVLVAMGSSRQT